MPPFNWDEWLNNLLADDLRRPILSSVFRTIYSETTARHTNDLSDRECAKRLIAVLENHFDEL